MTEPADAAGDLDPGYLIDLAGGDRSLIDEILAAFVEDVPPRVGAIARAIEAGDLTEAARLAHSLKGASGSLGATRLHLRATALEHTAKAHDLPRSRALAAAAAEDLSALMARLAVEPWSA